MTPAQVGAALALLAAAVLVGSPGGGPRLRLHGVARRPGQPAARWRAMARPFLGMRGRTAVLLAAAVAATAGAAAGGPVAALAGALAGGGAARMLLRRSANRARAAAELVCLDALAGLADDLRAGRTPDHALGAAVETIAPVVDEPARRALRAVTGASAAGSDLAAALGDVRHPGLAATFERLAAVWRLSDAGVPLASLLDSLEAELRAHRRATERSTAQLAAARTTSRLLAGLPVLGFVLGFALGVDPLDVVLHTAPGGVCAALAMALQVAGTAWTERLGRSAVAA